MVEQRRRGVVRVVLVVVLDGLFGRVVPRMSRVSRVRSDSEGGAAVQRREKRRPARGQQRRLEARRALLAARRGVPARRAVTVQRQGEGQPTRRGDRRHVAVQCTDVGPVRTVRGACAVSGVRHGRLVRSALAVNRQKSRNFGDHCVCRDFVGSL